MGPRIGGDVGSSHGGGGMSLEDGRRRRRRPRPGCQHGLEEPDGARSSAAALSSSQREPTTGICRGLCGLPRLLPVTAVAATAAVLLLLGAGPAPASAFFQGPRLGAPSAATARGIVRAGRWIPGGMRIRGEGWASSRLWATRPPPPPEEEADDRADAAVGSGECVDGAERGEKEPREKRPRSRSPAVLGFSRNDALGALGVAAFTGLAITTARPDLTTASLGQGGVGAAGGAAAGVGARGGTVPATSSVIAASKKGYLGWRRLSDVEARAKDQNKGQVTYPVRFVAYLTRFLLNFDEDDKALWARLAREIPFTYTEQKVDATRRAQFAALADSVEIGLYDYQGPEGIPRLFDLLRNRYGQTLEGRRQIAILFSFLEKEQPVERIARLLSDTDNASVAAFRLITGGDGYTAAQAPRVTITSPMMSTPQPAKARAVLRDTGTIRRITLTDSGCVYTHGVAPEVVVSAPPKGPDARRAKAVAVLDPQRPGRLREVRVVDPGSGYSSKRPVTVEFLAQGPGEAEEQLRLEAAADGRAAAISSGGESAPLCTGDGGARAVVVLDREVAGVELVDGGAGYVVPIGAEVSIDAPAEADGKRAVATAVVKPTVTAIMAPSRYDPGSLSAQLQQLLPSDTVLEFDPTEQRFVVGGEEELLLARLTPEETTLYDPVFGPVGRSPIEMERELTLENYVRLALSGGCCISIVRTSLQPLELLKTRLQARPDLYPGWSEGIARIKDEGATAGGNPFYKAWDCTSLAGFLLGMLGFGLNEFFRRALTDLVGPGSAEVFEIPIILGASALSTIITCLLTCPLEAVRIRVMSTAGPVPALGFVRVGQDMFKTMGIGGLYDGLEPLLFREVPFIMTKFLVFDAARSFLFSLFPAAKEAANYSLLVSFLSGIAAGVAGAFTGCPADAVLTRVNVQPEETDWRAMVKVMLAEPGGWRNLFAGVDIRVVFFALLIGIQFFLYDWFKQLFGVAPDDLTLVLDVLGAPAQQLMQDAVEGGVLEM